MASSSSSYPSSSSGPIRIRSGFDPIRSDPLPIRIRSDPIRSDPVRSGPIQSDPVRYNPILLLTSHPPSPHPTHPLLFLLLLLLLPSSYHSFSPTHPVIFIIVIIFPFIAHISLFVLVAVLKQIAAALLILLSELFTSDIIDAPSHRDFIKDM